jgi:ASC-1-like (ASCH) protein
MKIHRLHCQDPWFSLIEIGKKTVEGRKNLPKFHNWKPGDLVVFHLDAREFKTRIRNIRGYKTLEDYLLTEGLEQVLPGVKSLKEGIEIYTQWSTPKEIDTFGFLAIEVERVT